jgi:WD40 repeat protein
MFRWLAVCILLAAGTVTIMYVVSGLIPQAPANPIKDTNTSPNAGGGEKPAPAPPVADDGGNIKPLVIFEMGTASRGLAQAPTVIPGGRVYPVDTQDVPSERDGKLVCIGTEIKQGENVSDDKREKGVTFAFLVVELTKAEKWTGPTYSIDGKLYRRFDEKDPLEAGKGLRVHREKRDLRILQVGEKVDLNQLLAVVNPSIAIDELNSKVAKLESAEADVKVSSKTKDEAQKRYESATVAYRGKAVSEEDWRAAKLAWDRYIEEEFAKRAAVRQSLAEVQAALTALQMYEIRASVPGVVKQIYKHPRGEAIKNLESILQIQNHKLLRVQAEVDVQLTGGLEVGMPAVIEAAHPVPPAARLAGHGSEVTCVAVSKDPANPLIVSGSEDRTVRVWARQDGRWSQRWQIPVSTAVRAVACTGRDAPQNLALIGAWDGSVHLLDLDKKETRPMAARHPKPVNCAAFSPNGNVCATGDDDRSIYFWNTADGQLLYALRGAHRAQVTSLQFASPTMLVSAGNDQRLVAWDVADPKNPRLVHQFDHRGGAVKSLGVSHDGKYVLSDHGRELRRMSLENEQIDGIISNPTDSANFSGMALFSPDGLCVLTNGDDAGRLQLWRTPSADARAEELRQYIWTAGAATCGAFAPDSTFAVTGTRDSQVLVWEMPKTKAGANGPELEEPPLRGTLTLVDHSLNDTTRQVRVWAELIAPEWLTPGSTATIVIPKKK